ncbi:MAG: hypothetical protein GC192_11660 [Bacteroidetes bacterium]|nr:hypothetical protein [Bacteroidota bacterium]
MVNIEINHLKLHKILLNRIEKGDSVASVLNGLLISLSGDASELLGFVRYKFPSYTSHDLQHSWRILKRIEAIITDEALNSLSTIEIFSLIIAVAFHDIGMIDKEIDSKILRGIHHEKSEEFLNSFLSERMSSISEYSSRLVKCIGFIARAHGMTWEDLNSNEYFNRIERILEQPLRVNVLSILIRVGDLLDLDSDRSCDPLRKYTNYFDNVESNFHHDRHKKVCHFNYDTEIIEVEVVSDSKEEHAIWTEWFGYLSQDILHANTYVLKGDLGKFQLPKFYPKVTRNKNANFELWPLRFEIDEKGRIWDIISQSVYTGKFDFIRELIQNAIDACLKWIYINPAGIVKYSNPKKWILKNYQPLVSIYFSNESQKLTIQDNGIGMGKDSLKKFLFNVASSGYKGTEIKNGIPFPSIASFGIGFVSCLVRANKIIINTKSREAIDQDGREVVLKTEALDAYSEIKECEYGTIITLLLNKKITFNDILIYLQSRFYSPSVSINVFDLDTINYIAEFLNIKERLTDGLSFESMENNENLLSIIKSEINNHNKTNKDKFTHSSFHYRFEPKDNIGRELTSPIFLFLDKMFQIRYLTSSFTKNDLIHENSLVFISVRYIDDEIGIEWFSVHGFVLHERCHKKTIIRYTGLADRYRNEDKIIVRSEYEWQNEDVEDIDLDDDFYEEDDDYEGDLDYGKNEDDFYSFVNEISFSRSESSFSVNNYSDNDRLKLSENINGIMISDIQEESLKEFKFFENQRSPILDKKGKVVKKFVSDEDDKKIAAIESLILYQLNSSVYQDGIILPLKAWAIAPIGSCYGKVNFFGKARFELNITRNSINESPILLENWMENIGGKIQNAIIDKVVDVFESNKIDFTLENLFTEKKIKGQDSIYEYSLPLLKGILKKKAKKI